MNETERPPSCHKCTEKARYVVQSAVGYSKSLACGRHLPDRVSYELGRAVRVDVRLVEVTA